MCCGSGASTNGAFSKRMSAYQSNYRLNGEIIAEAHNMYTILHPLIRLVVYLRNFRTKNKNTEEHSQPEKNNIGF